MLLTLEEMRDILTALDPETKRLPPGFRAFGNAIEAAVLKKLCAGVGMPEAASSFHVTPLYEPDQLRAYGAAQRLKALEDCLNEIEGWANDQSELKAAIRALRGAA